MHVTHWCTWIFLLHTVVSCVKRQCHRVSRNEKIESETKLKDFHYLAFSSRKIVDIVVGFRFDLCKLLLERFTAHTHTCILRTQMSSRFHTCNAFWNTHLYLTTAPTLLYDGWVCSRYTHLRETFICYIFPAFVVFAFVIIICLLYGFDDYWLCVDTSGKTDGDYDVMHVSKSGFVTSPCEPYVIRVIHVCEMCFLLYLTSIKFYPLSSMLLELDYSTRLPIFT